jgi:hypothetical protein
MIFYAGCSTLKLKNAQAAQNKFLDYVVYLERWIEMISNVSKTIKVYIEVEDK